MQSDGGGVNFDKNGNCMVCKANDPRLKKSNQ